jgi:fluoride ion exporter CrcB/FEX
VLLANLAAAGALEVALLAAVANSPAELRVSLVQLLLPAAAIIAALPLLLLRGGTSARPPIPLLLGHSPARWVIAQLTAGLASALLLVVPLLVGLAIYAPGSFTVSTSAAYVLATVGVVLAISWLAPTSPDNPLGQAVTGFVAFCAISALLVTLDGLLHEDSLLWTLVMLLVAIMGCTTAVVSESRMWSTRNRPVRQRRARAGRAVRRRMRVTAAHWFVLTVALLVAGLIDATAHVQSSPIDTRFELRLWFVPFFESFRRSGLIGLSVEWGTVAALAGPIVAALLIRVRQLARMTSGSPTPSPRRDSSSI